MGRSDSRRRDRRRQRTGSVPRRRASTMRTDSLPSRARRAWGPQTGVRVALTSLACGALLLGLVDVLTLPVAGVVAAVAVGLVGAAWVVVPVLDAQADRPSEAPPTDSDGSREDTSERGWGVGPYVALVAALSAVVGPVTAARDTSVDGVGAVVAAVLGPLLTVLALLVGVLVGALFVVPLVTMGRGLRMVAHGDRAGALLVLVGLWFLSIGAYPTCLALAGDGPRRSLGITPLLGIDTNAWTIIEPGWLWPARVFALIAWTPLVAVIGWGAVGRRLTRRTSSVDAQP